MAGLADVFTLALSVIGISEMVDDPTANNQTTKTLRKFWPTARDLTLRDFPWACARKSKAMSLHSQDVPGWELTYNYPDDCLFALAVMPETGLRSPTVWRECWESAQGLRPVRYPFDRMLRDDNNGQVIVTDLADAHLLYIARVENPVVYDMGLVMTCAAKLGQLVAPTFKVKAEFVRLAADTYEIERAKATANSFNEGYPDEEPVTPSIAARG
jgi:hypothetical protein